MMQYFACRSQINMNVENLVINVPPVPPNLPVLVISRHNDD